MTDLMLIDAAHSEELRVVVLRDDKVEEFDYESSLKKPLKGNIYLAKVTRVEPSLQAAFVDYGGNRHGFLAFSEIHPDYFQIPISDRDGLSVDEEENTNTSNSTEAIKVDDAVTIDLSDEKKATDDITNHQDKVPSGTSNLITEEAKLSSDVISDTQENNKAAGSNSDEANLNENANNISETSDDNSGENIVEVNDEDSPTDEKYVEKIGENNEAKEYEEIEDEKDKISKRINKKYKIQEVIKKNQILLIQVVKEERGNKGAALTTYLSLAGRYCVLMPNTNRGGGISRKITDPNIRKNVKKIAESLALPDGMGIILRTAGANRTKIEIKRDYEYLMRLWENIRDLTLKSIAPRVVYEEGNLIKRSIRDLYNKQVVKVIIHGDEGFLEAKNFMKMLLPSHVKNIKKYTDPVPLFIKYKIERQIDNLFSPIVQLESGGYLVIHQTEALVSIDVNSGKATKNFSVEETALQTNLEATKEISRHLRLRDMSGLVVVDFIDMEDRPNRRAVERAMKDCLRKDRARIQMGRISIFGLMEMSRQRLRASVLEGTTDICPNCLGAGHVKSTELTALHILREVELSLLNQVKKNVVIYASPSNAMFILNHKRQYLIDLENRLKIKVRLEQSNHLLSNSYIIKHDSESGEISTHLRDAAIQLDASSDDIKSSTASSADIIASNGLVPTRKNYKGSRYPSKDKRGRGRNPNNRRPVNRRKRYEPEDAINNSEAIDANDVNSNAVQTARGKPSRTTDNRKRGVRPRKRNTDRSTTNSNAAMQNNSVRTLSEEEMKLYHQDVSKLSNMNNNAPAQENTATIESDKPANIDVSNENTQKANEKQSRARRAPRKTTTNSKADTNTKADTKTRTRKPRINKSDAATNKNEQAEKSNNVADEKPIAASSNGSAKTTKTTNVEKVKDTAVTKSSTKKEEDNKPPRKGWWSRTNFF